MEKTPTCPSDATTVVDTSVQATDSRKTITVQDYINTLEVPLVKLEPFPDIQPTELAKLVDLYTGLVSKK